jgi:hypothetical protein
MIKGSKHIVNLDQGGTFTPDVIPGLQRREVGGCSFCFFSLIQLLFWGFGIFVNNIHN